MDGSGVGESNSKAMTYFTLPKHLRTEEECNQIPMHLREHINDLSITPPKEQHILLNTSKHRAKYAPGLATTLVALAGTKSIGDPMAGTGTLFYETQLPMALNDIDEKMTEFLSPLVNSHCEVSYLPATEIRWHRETCIFSPPYYPRTDRLRPAAHNDVYRGPIVGFRDSYNNKAHPEFIGNPGGVNAILTYRKQMTRVYAHLRNVCGQMIVVTKNWVRLNEELRLDLDTILMAQSVGWTCINRHGWIPPPSLWARYNANRANLNYQIEDILLFS